MDQWLLHNQLWCEGILLLLAFGIFALIESSYPWRPWLVFRLVRWKRHFSLAIIDILCVRLIFPGLTVGAAIIAHHKGMGLLNHSHLPTIVLVILGILLMDLVVYLQHRMYHKYRWLWRFHRVHHMDKEIDVSTGLRFHPIEALLTVAAKVIGVALFGVLPLAAFLFELWLIIATLFDHINVHLNFKIDSALRWFVITPNMHRIHHSDYAKETNSNYGFCLSWWDRFFGTYTAFPRTTDRKISIGLEDYQDPKYQTLENMLLMPFNPKSLKVLHKKPMKTHFKAYEE